MRSIVLVALAVALLTSCEARNVSITAPPVTPPPPTALSAMTIACGGTTVSQSGGSTGFGFGNFAVQLFQPVPPGFFSTSSSLRLTAGSTLLNFTATTIGSWLTFSPTSGLVAPGSSAVIALTSMDFTKVVLDTSGAFTLGGMLVTAPGYSDKLYNPYKVTYAGIFQANPTVTFAYQCAGF